MPWVDDSFEHLNKACYFSQMDLKLGYYQICIMDANVENMAMRIRSVFYELLVMLFKLCNVPLAFIILMKLIFHDKLHEFIITYVYDVLGFFLLAKEHT